MIENSLLEQLVAFAENGTLSAAAEQLHTSQPALSRAMRKLEDDLGLELFIHGKNRLTLNEVGQHAAMYAAEVLQANQEFEAKLKSYAKSLRTISIGFCAPVPQAVLTPIINNVFSDMTISADMSDDVAFLGKLKSQEYNLAVLHYAPDDPDIYAKKCGHEDLFISLTPGDPLTFYPEIHLKDLDGKSILLFSRIGFWAHFHADKTPNTKYLLQIDRSSFQELTIHSEFPSFSSSYFLNRGELREGKVHIPIVDPECHTDYYLCCLDAEKSKYQALFSQVHDDTIR